MRDFLQMELNSQRGVGRGLNWIKPNLEYITDQSNILIDLSWWQSNGIPKCYTLIKVCSFSRRCISAFYFLLQLGSVCVKCFRLRFSQNFSATEFFHLLLSDCLLFSTGFSSPECLLCHWKEDGRYFKRRISEKFWDFIDEKKESLCSRGGHLDDLCCH